MRDKGKLTHNAIMYASVGFKQECILQVLNVRPGSNFSLEMVVYDGIVYAGAHYNYSNDLRREKNNTHQMSKFQPESRNNNPMSEDSNLPRQLDVIKADTIFHDKAEPLQLRNVEVVARGQVDLWGNQVLSLEQYMKRRRFINYVDVEEQQDLNSEPNKRVKSIIQSLNLSEVRAEAEKQQFPQTILNQINSYQNPSNRERKNPESQPNISQSNLLKKDHTATNDNSNRSSPEGKNHGIIPNTNNQPVQISEEQQTQAIVKEQKSVIKQNGVKDYPEEEKIDGAALQTIQKLFADPQSNKKSKKIQIAKDNIIDLLDDQPPQPTPQKSQAQGAKQEKTPKKADMMISELYERMHRFKILCRINHITHFTSQRGNPCTKLILIDQKGDEIMCMIYDKGGSPEQSQSGKVSLLRGRTYIFESGEVSQDESGYTSIVLSWGGIQQTKILLPSFHPTKMMRVGQLQNISASHYLERAINTHNKSINTKRSYSKELNVCGIFKGFRDEPKLINNQFRIIGILCDPDHEKSVNFTLYLDELTSFPLSGTVISLHNMHLCEHERTYRLDQSKRSYYIVQQNNTHQYFADLVEASAKETWKQKEYNNMSQIKYVSRTIAELKGLLSNMLEQDQCYSELDCNIASLKEKREFPACASCLHDIKAEKGLRTYCYHCKKIERTIKRFIFTSEVADSTGSIVVTIFSEEITAFINTTAQDYSGMSNEDRAALLELSSFQNILLRVKSQQQVGGASHLAVRAEKNSHRRGLEQIKEQSISRKTKYLPPWL